MVDTKAGVQDVTALGDKHARYVARGGKATTYCQTIIPDGATVRVGKVVIEGEGNPCNGVDMTADGDCIIPPDCYEVSVVFRAGKPTIIKTKAWARDKSQDTARDTAESE